jgi:hypothetical protein
VRKFLTAIMGIVPVQIIWQSEILINKLQRKTIIYFQTICPVHIHGGINEFKPPLNK